MTIGFNLRPVLAGGAVSLALALAPVSAQASNASQTNGGAPGVYVCNEAGMAFWPDGSLAVLDPSQDPNPPARHKASLQALPGNGVGLVHAAANSPALALCGTPEPAYSGQGGDGTGGDTPPADDGFSNT